MITTYCDRARDYARRVVACEETAGLLEILACQRFLDDLQRAQEDPSWPYRFDEDAAVRPCAFIEGLHHIKGRWARQRLLIRLEDWQLFIICNLFGWVRRDTGMRRFTTSYWEVARKNTKSTLGAAIGLYMFAADGEAGAEVFSAATTGKQAAIVFKIAAAMTRREPEFHAAGVDVQMYGIYMPEDERKFEPLNAEGSTLDGLNVHCAVIDELHAHKRRDVYDVIDTARGSRDQALLLSITTAGSDRTGICYEQRSYLVKILQGVLKDDNYFGIIYTIDDTDDWMDPKCWRKANPNYGISVLTDNFERAAHEAFNKPTALNNFLTKHLNVWVSGEHAWMDMRAWKLCERPGIKPEDYAHLPCYIGLDLASKIDMVAKARLFVDEPNKKYYLFVDYYLPERAVTEAANSQYDGWERMGLLTVTPGEMTDYDLIEEELIADTVEYDVQECPYDPHNAVQLVSHMLAHGVPMVEIIQNVKNLSEPLKELQAQVYAGNLLHDGNEITTWMASNVMVEPDRNENIFPRKERPENKIDGIVAAIMALGRAMKKVEQADLSEFINEPVTG